MLSKIIILIVADVTEDALLSLICLAKHSNPCWRNRMPKQMGYGKEPGAHAAILATLRTGVNFWGVRDEVLASTVGQLGALHCPTLILWGKQDAIFPAKLGEQAQRAIPQARLHLFDQCGHNPQVEQREEFHRQVLGFLAAR